MELARRPRATTGVAYSFGGYFFPVFRLGPALYDWVEKRRIYKLYSELKHLEDRRFSGRESAHPGCCGCGNLQCAEGHLRYLLHHMSGSGEFMGPGQPVLGRSRRLDTVDIHGPIQERIAV